MAITKLPLVCGAALQSLEADLDGESVLCRVFVGRYVEMWPQRCSRIQAAVAAGDWESAMDAALSLRSSSVMVGAARLGQLASNLVQLLKDDCHDDSTRNLRDLRRCGNQTMAELTACYLCTAT